MKKTLLNIINSLGYTIEKKRNISMGNIHREMIDVLTDHTLDIDIFQYANHSSLHIQSLKNKLRERESIHYLITTAAYVNLTVIHLSQNPSKVFRGAFAKSVV